MTPAGSPPCSLSHTVLRRLRSAARIESACGESGQLRDSAHYRFCSPLDSWKKNTNESTGPSQTQEIASGLRDLSFQVCERFFPLSIVSFSGYSGGKVYPPPLSPPSQ